MNRAVSQSVARGFEGDLRLSVRIQLLWNIVPTIIGFGSAFYYFANGNASLGTGLVCIALFSPVINTFNTYSAFLTGKKDFRRIFLYNIVSYAFYYPAMFAAVALLRDPILLILVNLASNAAAVLFLYRRTLRAYQPNTATDAYTIPYGMHLSIMNAFGAIVTQLDTILVFHFLGAAELAIYSFASMLPERIGGLLGFIGPAALPKFATQTHAEIQRHILSKVVRALLAGALLALIYSLAAPLLFKILFPRYVDAVIYTQVYSLAIAMMAATSIVSNALFAQRLKFELYVTSIVNPLVLVFLQIPLLLTMGIMGMLIAKILSDAFNILLGIVLILRKSDAPVQP
jgi:O-antigen/teichoic acid export membrane protein